jgi:hypothetical protein
MGKRELLLIAGFILVGVMVYLVTAPEPAPGQQGFSIARLVDGLRREVRGHQASAEVRTSSTTPIPPGVTELRLDPKTATVSIAGEDRKDVAFDLLVWSNGFDEAEARKYATATRLKVAEVGSSLVVGIEYPDPGQQRATLTIRIPAPLALRIQPSRGKLDLSNIASAELVEARGQVTIKHVTDRLSMTHRGGTLTLESIGSLKLNTRGSVVSLKGLTREGVIQMQAGELRANAVGGPLEIETNGSTLQLEDLSATRKPLQLTTVGGSVTMTGIVSETRIDSRDTRLDVTIEKPARVDVYAEGEEPLLVTLPEGGFDLEAVTLDSRLIVPEGFVEVKSSESEARASAPIDGGGPKITLRASRGDITIRPRKPGT